MELIGFIVQASKNFTRLDWLEHIAVDDCLVPPAPREVFNPANGKFVVVFPSKDSVGFIVDEKELGAFFWSQNETPLIVVQSVAGAVDVVRAHALRIALIMGGKFEGYPDS